VSGCTGPGSTRGTAGIEQPIIGAAERRRPRGAIAGVWIDRGAGGTRTKSSPGSGRWITGVGSAERGGMIAIVNASRRGNALLQALASAFFLATLP
jgi:hypothetical protein